jgi:hypothetical protein
MQITDVPFSASKVLELADGLQITRYLTIASLAVLVYDHLATLDQEVRILISSQTKCGMFIQIKFFWNGRWSLTRVLFLAVSSLKKCRRGFLIEDTRIGIFLLLS